MKEDLPCPVRVLSTRQLVSSSPGSCCTRIFSSKTSVHALSSALLPWFIALWLFAVPQTEVTIERAPIWRCSRHPSSCDIESSDHTTSKRAEVLPVFARSCHSLYWCRRDILWIKYRQYSSLLFQFYSITSVSLHNCQTVYVWARSLCNWWGHIHVGYIGYATRKLIGGHCSLYIIHVPDISALDFDWFVWYMTFGSYYMWGYRFCSC